MNHTTRSWKLYAALLAGVIAVSCVDHEPAGPKGRDVRSARLSATNLTGSADPFFVAWHPTYISGPITTQASSGPDSRQYRQHTSFTADDALRAFAAANPGKLYINGDEPDQSCISPYAYDTIYHDYVEAIRAADPTARFSPAGFAEPNEACCPNPPGDCFNNMHSVGYAEQFYNGYIQAYGVAPRVDEWRFHDFGNPYFAYPVGDINAWWTRVSNTAAWSVAHGANMVLGSWGFIGWYGQPTSTFLAHMQQGMDLLRNDPRINQAVWWSYEFTGWPHNLLYREGILTPEGEKYANLPIQIPQIIDTVSVVGSAAGHAKVRWINSSSQWGIEAQFWRQAGGSGPFVHHHTYLVAANGTETPHHPFVAGDRIKGRVRYYHAGGVGYWARLSKIFVMP